MLRQHVYINYGQSSLMNIPSAEKLVLYYYIQTDCLQVVVSSSIVVLPHNLTLCLAVVSNYELRGVREKSAERCIVSNALHAAGWVL